MSDRIEYPIILDGSCCEPKAAKSLVSMMLDSVEARLNGVTDGPWKDENCGTECCVWIASAEDPDVQLAGVDTIANAKFMARARTDIPALVALARQQDTKLMAIRELVENSIHRISIEELRAVLNTTSES